MVRYKIIDRSRRFLPVVLDAQLMPGSFEYSLLTAFGEILANLEI